MRNHYYKVGLGPVTIPMGERESAIVIDASERVVIGATLHTEQKTDVSTITIKDKDGQVVFFGPLQMVLWIEKVGDNDLPDSIAEVIPFRGKLKLAEEEPAEQLGEKPSDV